MDVQNAFCGMDEPVIGFDWDDGNVEKCQKHGVSRLEIELALGSRPAVAPDLKHSGSEQRYIAVYRNAEGRPMFIAFTFRQTEGGVLIRPVSARYMHKKEAAAYEKSTHSEN
jgi:uncharacterized DUF497 family protein